MSAHTHTNRGTHRLCQLIIIINGYEIRKINTQQPINDIKGLGWDCTHIYALASYKIKRSNLIRPLTETFSISSRMQVQQGILEKLINHRRTLKDKQPAVTRRLQALLIFLMQL